MEDWILDLCSGLGGASEAFAVDPHWTVIRIENNPELAHVPFTFNYDVLEWMDWLPHLISSRGRPTIIWASPPCLEFSQAYSSPKSIANREGIFFQPDMSILEAIIDIIDYAIPRFHIIENVNGASPHFLPYLGRHQQKIGPFLLWGDFPKLYLKPNFTPHKYDNDPGHRDPLRANKKALVPLPISEAVLDAVCAQSKLSDWI
jgi:site-specific DNA-cytosine methylase